MKAEALRYSDSACQQHGYPVRLAEIVADVDEQAYCLDTEEIMVIHIVGIMKTSDALLVAQFG